MTRFKNFYSTSFYFITILSHASQIHADQKHLPSDPEDDSKVTFEKIEVSAEPLSEPFKNTKLIKNNLGLANDGAELLKQSPGISVIRQGGTASDPLLRGLGGTRLNISIDGVPYAGACNHRMDPATAYVKPGTFDSLSLLKGPQSVRFGNSIVGTVNFDREAIKYDQFGARGYASYVYGSFDQQDLTVDASTGFNQGYIAYTHNNSRSGNYTNGDGREINLTFFDTANDRLAIGYTPDDDTVFEINGLLSEGQMGNATIHMDVTKLDRQNYGMHFKKENINDWFKSIDLKYNYTQVDHTMDDFTLRPNDGLDHGFILMGQDWARHYAKLETIIEINARTQLISGLEYKHDRYDARANGLTPDEVFLRPNIKPTFNNIPNNHILDFDNYAAYAELSYQANPGLRWIAGLRGDSLGTDTGTMHAAGEVSTLVLSGSNKHRRQALISGFLRGEYALDTLPMVFSVGYGHAERAADYWEVYSMDGFSLDEERNDEVDAMLSYQGDDFNFEVSAFYSYISDFILVHRGDSVANINAHRTGGEINASYDLFDFLTMRGNVAYVYGQNLTQNVPLAQTPPLEGNISLNYNQGPFDAKFNTRLVSEQTRIHQGFGNVLALDTTPTGGFVVSSLELGYKPHPAIEFKFGIDNLFDKTYSEHISRNSSPVAGPATKINEPGRAYWGRISINLDYPE